MKQTSIFANTNNPVLQQQASLNVMSNNQANSPSSNIMSNNSSFQGLQNKRRRDDDEDYDM